MKIKDKVILVLGSTIAKMIWIDQAEKLATLGYSTLFYVRKKTSFTREDDTISTVEIPKNPIRHIRSFYRILKKYRPHHIEAFHDLYRWDFLLLYGVYVGLAKFFKIPIISICTGGEILYWKKHYFLKKWSVKLLLRSSHTVILKEPYHKKYIDTYKIYDTKKIPTLKIPNAVEIRTPVEYRREEDIVLFLNSFKKWRHPDILLKAFKIVNEELPRARLILAGYRPLDDMDLIKKELEKSGGDTVKLIPYRLDNRLLFSSAKVFVLPADLIYLNNSLLEAMERGVPAIIGNVDRFGSRIIKNQKNGFIVDITPEAIAEKIILLLTNEDLRLEMGKAARNTVTAHFNYLGRIKNYLDLYDSLRKK